jgi:hypothetical protein
VKDSNSTTEIPSYIEDRIRRPPPPNSSVVPGSTPVLSFGDAQRATVATLGLNPSRVEFLDRHGNELTGDSRRLATHISLETSDLITAPIEIVSKVLEDCNGYFHRNPYRRWFDQLHPVLTACGASYYDGSACHLDLVQWATDPTWGKLTPVEVRAESIAGDAQSMATNGRILLVDGFTLTAANTSENQQVFPQNPAQKEGLGSQLIRGVRLTSMVMGLLFDLVLGPYAGKQSGEPIEELETAMFAPTDLIAPQ